MSRIQPPDLDDDLQAELAPYRLPDGRAMELFALLAHAPAALRDLRRATTTVLRDLDLPIRARELVVLRTLARAGAGAEWALHVHLFGDAAQLAGLEPTAIATDPKSLPAPDQRLLQLADACHDHAGVLPDGLWEELTLDGWSTGQLVGLLVVAGQYRKVAVLVNALQVPVPAGLQPLPRAGSAGTSPDA
jgi:4-carboxymuconolactone decarboxylase